MSRKQTRRLSLVLSNDDWEEYWNFKVTPRKGLNFQQWNQTIQRWR